MNIKCGYRNATSYLRIRRQANTMSELTIEPADTGLADEFPPLVYDTNPGLWDYVWGDAPDEFQTTLSSAFKEQRGIFSHALTRVAQLNGEPVGICLCYTADQKKTSVRSRSTTVPERCQRSAGLWSANELALRAIFRRKFQATLFSFCCCR